MSFNGSYGAAQHPRSEFQAPGPFRGREGQLEHGDGVVGAPEVWHPLGVEGDDVGGERVAAEGRIGSAAGAVHHLQVALRRA